jgi:hypothetical protein
MMIEEDVVVTLTLSRRERERRRSHPEKDDSFLEFGHFFAKNQHRARLTKCSRAISGAFAPLLH